MCTNNAGQLLSKFEQRKLAKKLDKNPLENSIIWRTQCPRMDSSEIDIESQGLQVSLLLDVCLF